MIFNGKSIYVGVQNGKRTTLAMTASEGGDVPVYEGSYEVTPSSEKQILDTDGKLMSEDLTINEIPVSEVSNNQGGTTITIG